MHDFTEFHDKDILASKLTPLLKIKGVQNVYRTQVSLGSDLWVLMSLTQSVSPRGFVDLTDVTLADEDSKSKPADYVNRAILGNVAMQVPTLGGQTCN